ncbi:Uncharacterised protein [Mycoplasmopsis maculosa]|uniref:Lipoprotein n=2 Tax=Mycoplasmopsis maculosa TaxID=114885 RepID=A0A449B3X5_9BACT|nr:hypothetical protein [Mycoplasmopsis maculosa]VEU75303.1 Uncharacterised protein [Mycoplasmopsis maculosa]
MKNKKILKWIGAVAPILSLPILSASCLEKVNLILNGNREGEKDKENPETSTNPTPNPTTPPKDSTEPIKKEDEKPKITHSEIINNFKEVYSNNAMLDANPKAFNDAGNFLAYDLRTDPKFPYSLKLPDPLTIILKHPTAIWYYSGIKKYYDYILQMDNVYNNKQQLQNRLNRLFNEGSTEFINTNYSTKRLGIVWKDALTYNLDKIINAYEDIYTKSSEFSSMYHGVLPLDFGEKETELLEKHNEEEADWNNHGQNLERETMNPKISYKEMYDISKQFYKRLDRHFLQERINHKNKTLSLEAVPNKDIKAADYFNDWYNFKFPFPVDQSSKNYIGVFSYGFQTYLEKRWNPYDFYNNSIVLAPFKAIQNSNIMATSLKVLKILLTL